MSDDGSADLVPLFTREQASNAFRAALAMFVGRGRRHSVSELSAGAGIPRRILDCYRGYPFGHPDHRPLHEGQRLSIIAYVGADFTTAYLRLAGQAAYNLPDIEPDPGELAAQTSEDSAKVVRMAVDGDLTNDCPREQVQTGTRMMTNGAHLVSIGTRQRRRA